MKNKMRVLAFLLAFFTLVGQVFAVDNDIRRRQELEEQKKLEKLQAEYAQLRRELDRIKVNRWQDKRNSIAKKEAFQSMWNELQRDVETLQLKKNRQAETLVRLESQEEKASELGGQSKARVREFGISMSDKLRELTKRNRSTLTFGRRNRQQNMQALATNLEQRDYYPDITLVESYFSLHENLYDLGESRSVSHETLPLLGNPGTVAQEALSTRMAPGLMVRMGLVYQGFIADEENGAAILVKTPELYEKNWDWMEKMEVTSFDDMLVARKDFINDKGQPVLLPMDITLKDATGSGFRERVNNSFWKDVKKEMRGAGFAMYMIGPIFIIGFLLFVQKIVYIILRKSREKHVFAVFQKIETGDLQGALNIAKQGKSAADKVFKSVLYNESQRARAEEAVYETILHEGAVAEKGVSTVNIMAAAAPLAGLLGTVMGMVNLFASITDKGTGDPKVMAAGISEALLSTKWGLLAAIPLLLMYNWMQNNSNTIIGDMEKYSARALNMVFGQDNDKVEE
jgi:biopolymer transport protein ExbB/TolQ